MPIQGVKLLKEIKQLQELYQPKHSRYHDDPDNQPYVFYLTPTIYVRVTFNMIMALLFLVAAILCGLLGVVFDEDDKAEQTSPAIKSKCNKLKDLKSNLAGIAGDFAAKKPSVVKRNCK